MTTGAKERRRALEILNDLTPGHECFTISTKDRDEVITTLGKLSFTGRLEAMIETRAEYIRGIPIPPERHMALGAEQIQQRLSATVQAGQPLDLTEAVLAFVAALAHFSVAMGRPWSVTHDDGGSS